MTSAGFLDGVLVQAETLPPDTIRMMKDGLFESIQGEGAFAGTPSVFLRLAGCNLQCAKRFLDGEWRGFYCDTAASQADYDGVARAWRSLSSMAAEISVDDLAKVVVGKLDFDPPTPMKPARHLVITGGEPMLQSVQLTLLLAQLYEMLGPNPLHVVTLETNGTIFDDALAPWIDVLSLSPKPLRFGKGLLEPERSAIRNWVTAMAASGGEVQLKVVCSCMEDYNLALAMFNWVSGFTAALTCIIQPAYPVGQEFQCVVQRMIRDAPVVGGQSVRLIPQLHRYLGVP